MLSQSHPPLWIKAGKHFERENFTSAVPVTKVYTHPLLDFDESFDRDMCLLKISSQLQFGSGVAPVCLPDVGLTEEDPDFEFCVTTGWLWEGIGNPMS